MEGAVPKRWFDSAIEEILDGARQAPVLDHWGDRSSLTVREVRAASDVAFFAEVWRPSPISNHRYLCFESTVEVDQVAVRSFFQTNNDGWGLDEGDVDDLIRQLSAETLGVSVGNVLLAAHLAKPGALLAAERFIFSEHRFIRTEPAISLVFDSAMRRSMDTGWPKIGELRVSDALQWLIDIPGLLEGEPHEPAGRAISALSNLAVRPAPSSEDPVGLMWSMVGLEALYGEGNANLTQQISQKSKIVLGEPDAYRKAVTRMYDFRSRFIHGDVDFPLPYRVGDVDSRGFSTSMADAVQLAMGMLVATLQRMIVARLYSLKFEYRLGPTRA
jgi:hypothetical protein